MATPLNVSWFVDGTAAMYAPPPSLPVVAMELPVTEPPLMVRSEEHTSELQSPMYLVFRLLLEKIQMIVSMIPDTMTFLNNSSPHLTMFIYSLPHPKEICLGLVGFQNVQLPRSYLLFF